ncbi:MAG: response regulator [Blastocatellia bacterium]|nr:response regulator [Blastocatellia bacterium]
MTSRILLADDSITIQKVVNLTFADEGIEVVSVSNGEAAERQLGEINPDLVLADIFMPGKNGYELCEYIKESPEFHHVPVVLLVGAFEPFDQSEARRVRADAHLTKPFETRTLVETVRNLIGMSDKGDTQMLSSVPPSDGSAEEIPAPPAYVPVPPAPFNINLSEMSSQPALEETAPQAHTPLRDTAFSNDAYPVDAGPTTADADFSKDEDFFSSKNEDFFSSSDSPPGMGSTLELSSLGARQQPQPDALFGDTIEIDAPARSFVAEEESALSLGDEPTKDEDFFSSRAGLDREEEVPAWEGGRSAAAMEMDQGTPDMVLDFDRVEGADLPDSDGIGAFDVDLGPPAEAAVVVTDDVADAAPDQQPDAIAAEGPLWQVDDSSPLLGQEQTPQAAESQEVSGDLEMPSAEAVSLLSDDEPLGDLLEMDKAEEQRLSESRQEDSRPEAAPIGELTFEPVIGERATSFRPEAIEEKSLPFESAGATDETAFSVEEPFGGPPVVEEQEDQEFITQVMGSPDIFASSAPIETEPVFETGEALDFTSSAPIETEPVFETGEALDLTEPIGDEVFQEQAAADQEAEPLDFQTPDESDDETVESLAEVSPVETYVEEATETGEVFAASEMWTEEETHFRPVDIEATPVDEPEPFDGQATFGSEAEQVFEVSTEATLADAPAPAEAPVDEVEWQAVELPSEVVDEIVRRVVSQISDAVVREIAWEVVPDCVERVIEKLTREELSKKM